MSAVEENMHHHPIHKVFSLLSLAAMYVSACKGTVDGPSCGPGRYFVYTDQSCGSGSVDGTCESTSVGECHPGNWVCGCDGEVYPSLCDAQKAGVDTTSMGGCSTPADLFDCGDSYCVKATQVCVAFYGYNDPEPGCGWHYVCDPVPEECTATPTCECINNDPPVGSYGGCTGDLANGFRWIDGDCG